MAETTEKPHQFTDEELNTLKTNIGKEYFNQGMQKGIEIHLQKAVKTFGQKTGIEVPESANAIDLLDTIWSKAKETFEKEPNEKLKEKDSLLQNLQKSFTEKEKFFNEELTKKESDFNRKLTEIGLYSELSGKIFSADETENQVLKENAKDLFLVRHSVETIEGVQVVKNSKGEIIRDNIGNPKNLNDVFNEFLQANKFLPLEKQTGRGAQNVESSGLATIKTTEEFSVYADKQGLEKNSKERDKLYAEWKKITNK